MVAANPILDVAPLRDTDTIDDATAPELRAFPAGPGVRPREQLRFLLRYAVLAPSKRAVISKYAELDARNTRLGDKRRYLDQATLDQVTREHGALENSKTSRIFDNTDFGYPCAAASTNGCVPKAR